LPAAGGARYRADAGGQATSVGKGLHNFVVRGGIVDTITAAIVQHPLAEDAWGVRDVGWRKRVESRRQRRGDRWSSLRLVRLTVPTVDQSES
jgi:hypothetical protein